MNGTVNGNGVYRAPKNVVLCVLLCFVTCGIYSFFWLYGIIRDSKLENGETPGAGLELFLNLFIPFYGLYWSYKNGKRLNDAAEKKGMRVDDKIIVYLLCYFFGFQIVNMVLMQIDLNRLAEKPTTAYTYQQAPVQETWEPAGEDLQQAIPEVSKKSQPEMSKEHVQMLRELADLKEQGILTEEEFQAKKSDLLNKI